MGNRVAAQRQAKKDGSPLRILLIEDSTADARLTWEALKESRVPYELSVARDGVQGIEKLREQVESGQRPDLVLLDWNLPRMDGREVLRAVKSDPELRRIPVVVLTTSSADSDIDRAYDLQANCYITKPADVLRFFEIINDVEVFWTQTATLPA